jgi:hydrogenase expression/formation protein HypC
MCLGVPGQIVAIEEDPLGTSMGTVRFGGIHKEVCLAYVPDARVGEYVVVHVGFALSRIDEEEAEAVFALLEEMGDLSA